MGGKNTTHVLTTDASAISHAKKILRTGGLVAVPTETVYGLAARADLPEAVAGIYRAKGRPDFNPLIVHVAGLEQARQLAEMDERAERLAEAFWPGPLTMVLPLRAGAPVAPAATAGLPTIALRCPAHPAMQALARTYLADEMLMEQFKLAPAAKMMHHAYLGGLLEHTLTLMKIADAILPLYPKLNRDLVLMGLFLHDLGKTRELIYDRTFSYSDRGELIGHIVEGAIMLHDKAAQTMSSAGVRFPAHTVTVLQHIILSHHGIPEYGAAKIPATPEAILVSMLDNVDAKTTIALTAAKRDRLNPAELGGNFTEKQWALDTRLFRPDPLAP